MPVPEPATLLHDVVGDDVPCPPNALTGDEDAGPADNGPVAPDGDTAVARADDHHTRVVASDDAVVPYGDIAVAAAGTGCAANTDTATANGLIVPDGDAAVVVAENSDASAGDGTVAPDGEPFVPGGSEDNAAADMAVASDGYMAVAVPQAVNEDFTVYRTVARNGDAGIASAEDADSLGERAGGQRDVVHDGDAAVANAGDNRDTACAGDGAAADGNIPDIAAAEH